MITIVRSALILSFTSVLLLTAADVAFGQDTSVLTVRVVDVLDAPVPRARVTASARAGGPSQTALTADDGLARFGSLAAGDHLIEVEALGFARPDVTAIQLANG